MVPNKEVHVIVYMLAGGGFYITCITVLCVFHSQRLISRLVKLRQLDGETIREVEDEVKDEASVNSEPVPLGI